MIENTDSEQIERLNRRVTELLAEVVALRSASAQCAPTGDWPPPFEWMKLQARKPDGREWTDIFPSQLEDFASNGYDVRAIEPSALPSTDGGGK